ncbi:MAG: hypothetical protein SVR94_11355 [Pseudomonadota bacterium]|nr:hypothetical protein [Pseudomonadota bacterium]
MNSEAFYHRARIQGTLTTLSALHIGSGELEHKDNAVTYNAICRALYAGRYFAGLFG